MALYGLKKAWPHDPTISSGARSAHRFNESQEALFIDYVYLNYLFTNAKVKLHYFTGGLQDSLCRRLRF